MHMIEHKLVVFECGFTRSQGTWHSLCTEVWDVKQFPSLGMRLNFRSENLFNIWCQ